MIITEIKQAQKGKYIVVREDDAFLCLYTRELKGLEFEVDKECTEDQWAIGFKSVLTRGKKRVFHLLSRKDYTVEEIRRKLVREHYDEPLIQSILEYFGDYGYIDDANYVRKYYSYYKTTKSIRIIEQKLKQKGIQDSLLKEVLGQVKEEGDDYNSALGQAQKKYGRKELKHEEKAKMIQFLMRKGYSYGMSKEIIESLFVNTDKDC